MKNNGRQKAVYMALCVLAAIVVWVFVDNFGSNGGPNIESKWFRDIPITYTSETVLTGRGMMLLDEGTDATVDLKLSGTRWDLALLDKDYIKVSADLSSVTRTGEQTVSPISVSYSYSYFYNVISREQQSPSTISINVAELYHKTVDVRCEITGNVADGYSAGELQMTPTEIEVRGDKADVDAVSYVKVTLDLGEGATAAVTGDLPVQFYDSRDRLMEDTSLQASSDTIQVTLPVYVTKELELTMDFIESPGARLSNVDWEIEPSTVLVSGPADVLNSMESIVLDDFVLADLGSTTNYSYAIPIPEGCENLSGVTRATLHISFQDMLRTSAGDHQFPPGQRAGGAARVHPDGPGGGDPLRHQRGGVRRDGGRHPGDRGPGGLRLRRGHLHRPRGGDGERPRRGRGRHVPAAGHDLRRDRRTSRRDRRSRTPRRKKTQMKQETR